MFINKAFKSIVAKIPLLNLGLIISLGLGVTNPAPLFASNIEELEPHSTKPVANISLSTSIAQSSKVNVPLSDGTYLYGQSSKPEQIGQEYLVFKVEQDTVIGAVYMPFSEFSCFYGNVGSQQMNLSIVDPYDNTIYPYSIAFQELSPVATEGQINRAVTLEGYQQLNVISDNDKRILNQCLEEH